VDDHAIWGSGGDAAGITAARAALWAAVIPTMFGGSALVVPLLELDEAPAELEALLAAVVLPWPEEVAVVVAALEVFPDPLLAEVAVDVEPVVPDDAVAPWSPPGPPLEVELPVPVVSFPISRLLMPVMALHAAPSARARAATGTNRCPGKARMRTCYRRSGEHPISYATTGIAPVLTELGVQR
jgi:hypothetical protein